MSRKVPTSGPQAPLQSPFASLDPDSFPQLPLPVEAAPPPSSRHSVPSKRHRLVLRREKARRGGKTVIVVTQLPTHLSPPELELLLKRARKALGCGGSLHLRDLEIQGDQPDRVRHFLESEGFSTIGPG